VTQDRQPPRVTTVAQPAASQPRLIPDAGLDRQLPGEPKTGCDNTETIVRQRNPGTGSAFENPSVATVPPHRIGTSDVQTGPVAADDGKHMVGDTGLQLPLIGMSARAFTVGRGTHGSASSAPTADDSAPHRLSRIAADLARCHVTNDYLL
jgi:hypothetical protein